MHHPWRAFRHLPDWRLDLALLPDGLLGVTSWGTRTVTLDRRLLQAERRCTICHETIHIERGPLPSDPVLAAREEAAVEVEAARRLIQLDDLASALAWAHNVSEAADELWVDVPTLQTRLANLSEIERAHLTARLADR